MFETILENVISKKPLVHSITNNVTINDCANIILACGASPIMANDEREVEEITIICHSFVMNTGIVGNTTAAMIKAGKRSNSLGHPVILDPVAAGASTLRRETVTRIMEEVRCSVIRGNISEIKTIYGISATCQGVDAGEADKVNHHNLEEVIQMAKSLARRLDSVIAISGEIDIVADGQRAYVIYNGHPMMARITGSGCMLTALIGAFCGANPGCILEATAAAVTTMGICGETAYEKVVQSQGGTMSFRMHLIDAVSRMTEDQLQGGMKVEIR